VGSAQAQGMDVNPLHKAQNRDINSHECRNADLFSCSTVVTYIQTNGNAAGMQTCLKYAMLGLLDHTHVLM